MSAGKHSRLPQAVLLSPLDGGLPLIHALAERQVASVVLEPPGQAWVARGRIAHGRILGNLPEHTDRWLATLEQLADRHGDGVLISGSDRAVELLVAERSRIPERLRSFESPESAHLALMDKASLHEIAERAGVRAPWTLRLSATEQLDELAERAEFPCVLKPALSHVWRRRFGDQRALYVREPGELGPLATPALEAGLELVLSEYIPGPEHNLENAVILRREDGSHPLAYGLRRLRQYPPRSVPRRWSSRWRRRRRWRSPRRCSNPRGSSALPRCRRSATSETVRRC
jgi:D-aspartate ligase